MKKLIIGLFSTWLILASFPLFANYCATSDPAVQEYIEHLVVKHHFDKATLEKMFSTVTINEEVLAKVTKPTESVMTWDQYKALMITPARIEKGLAYWKTHEKFLDNIEKQYGVPPSIILAIIGVETKYGANKGNFPVFNTLATLAFSHGKREKFFRSELTEYLLLARENQLPTLLLKGSYAGAVGLPQFMPSSYRHYAVDANQKGYADLFNNDEDAISSVGNYLNKHGWKTGEAVAIRATCENKDCSYLVRKNFKPYYTAADLLQDGVQPRKPFDGKVSFISLKNETANEYWLGFKNFQVISTYNNSDFYIMAVNLLAEKLRENHHTL